MTDFDALAEEVTGEEVVAEEVTPQEVVQEEVVPEVVEYSPKNQDEEKAIRDGWKPKEQWVADGGDPDEWFSARRFNVNGKVKSKLRELEQKLATYDQSTRKVIEHVQDTERRKAEKAIEEARAAKWQALEDGDLEAARKAEGLEDSLRKAPKEEFAPVDPNVAAAEALWDAVSEVHPDARYLSTTPQFQGWIQKNPEMMDAYLNSPDPRDGIAVFNKFKGLKEQKRRTPPPVVEPQRIQAKPKVPTFDQLSAETRATFNEFVRLDMAKDTKENRDQYARECVERGEA